MSNIIETLYDYQTYQNPNIREPEEAIAISHRIAITLDDIGKTATIWSQIPWGNPMFKKYLGVTGVIETVANKHPCIKLQLDNGYANFGNILGSVDLRVQFHENDAPLSIIEKVVEEITEEETRRMVLSLDGNRIAIYVTPGGRSGAYLRGCGDVIVPAKLKALPARERFEQLTELVVQSNTRIKRTGRDSYVVYLES